MTGNKKYDNINLKENIACPDSVLLIALNVTYNSDQYQYQHFSKM